MTLKNKIPELYTPQEVAAIFKVVPRTVRTWSNAGLLPFVRTLGGHRRYRAATIDALVKASFQGRSR